VEAKSGYLKIEAEGASQRRKSEGENWRHTPKEEVGNASGRWKQTVQSNYNVNVGDESQRQEPEGRNRRRKPKMETQRGSKREQNTEMVTKKPKHREQIIPAMEC
jgi:hypothetical protein